MIRAADAILRLQSFRYSRFANRMRANRASHGACRGGLPLSLKPQDICILLKIVALDRAPWSYSQLAYELGMSASEVHAGVKRATEASLMRLEEGWGTPDPDALEELLVHGVKYVFTPCTAG